MKLYVDDVRDALESSGGTPMTAVWKPLQELIDEARRTVPDEDYPMWICAICGHKYGRREFNIATWHEDVCGICGRVTAVTEPRDAGGLRDDWQAEKRSTATHGTETTHETR